MKTGFRKLKEKWAKTNCEAVQKAAEEIGYDLGIEEIEHAFADMQELEDDELDDAAGGWCMFDHSCYVTFCHDEEISTYDACWTDWLCVASKYMSRGV